MNWLKKKEDKQDSFTGNGNYVIDFDSPFKRDSLRHVMIWITKKYNGEIEFSAKVMYENKTSKGEQEIKADTFNSLIDKVNVFINGMP